MVCVGLIGCGGRVDADGQLATIAPPLTVECTRGAHCPDTLGYGVCGVEVGLPPRCTFRCDDHVHHESGGELTNAEECHARGGTCEDVGGGHEFCSAL